MRKLIIIFLFLLPGIVFSQIDKIKLGTTLSEIRKVYPAIQPDAESMTSWIFSKDSVEGIKGNVSYTIQMDTMYKYEFKSGFISGPCSAYPYVDSAAYLKTIKAAERLYKKYLKIYGKPLEFHVQPARQRDSGQSDVLVFYAKWKQGRNELSIKVYRREDNADCVPSYEARYILDSSNPAYGYSFQVVSVGSGMVFNKSCGNGMSGEKFQKIHPNLAFEVKKFADVWVASDTVFPIIGTWRFYFFKGKLCYYSFGVQDGGGYTIGDSAYIVYRRHTIKFLSQAEKFYGKPDSLTETMPEKYQEINNQQFGYNTVYFDAAWVLGGNKLSILFLAQNDLWTVCGGESKIIHCLRIDISCGTYPDIVDNKD